MAYDPCLPTIVATPTGGAPRHHAIHHVVGRFRHRIHHVASHGSTPTHVAGGCVKNVIAGQPAGLAPIPTSALPGGAALPKAAAVAGLAGTGAAAALGAVGAVASLGSTNPGVPGGGGGIVTVPPGGGTTTPGGGTTTPGGGTPVPEPASIAVFLVAACVALSFRYFAGHRAVRLRAALA